MPFNPIIRFPDLPITTIEDPPPSLDEMRRLGGKAAELHRLGAAIYIGLLIVGPVKVLSLPPVQRVVLAAARRVAEFLARDGTQRRQLVPMTPAGFAVRI